MAYATHARSTAIAGGSFLDRLRDLRADHAARRARYRVYRSTVRELEVLTDRDLADLGINRSMIRGIAHEAAYGSK